MNTMLSADQISAIKQFQKNEITEYLIYSKLSKTTKDVSNAKILQQIGNDERRHYDLLKKYTKTEVKPNKWLVNWYYLMARSLGLTFSIKLMEGGEAKAQKSYEKYISDIPEVKIILSEEYNHEQELIGMIDEEGLKYVGSIVLGLNDALVELTGALAGLSLALQNTRLIAMAGLITGIAASFSMAASDYLSQKADNAGKDALKSSAYTGVAYIITVALLILPYLFLSNYMVCLGITLSIAIFIIFGFNYYISVAKELNFKRRFTEMAVISLSVSALSFFIGFIVKRVFGIDL